MLTARDIAGVLSHYDLGTPVEFSPAAHGYVNETAFVRTTRGRYVVRRNHRRFTEPLLRYRHALIAWLRERDAPVPPLIPTRDGGTLLQLNQRYYEVQAFVEGEAHDPCRPQQLASVGATLARYHRAVIGFPPPPAAAAPRYSPWGVDALATQLIERDVMGELHEPLTWYSQRSAQLRAALSDAVYAALPHLVIHGDIHSDNLRFRGDQVAALLDFDQASWDARLVDLADALVAFASEPRREQTWGVFSGPLDLERALLLLGAYAAEAPLTGQEAAALPPMIEVLWLQGELGRVRSTPEGAPEYHASVLDQGRALSAWMAANGPALAEQWAEAGAGEPLCLG